MDVVDVLNVGTQSASDQLGLVDATAIYRAKFRSQFVVKANLSKQQENELREIVDFPFTPVGGHNVTSDHPILYALRELVRQSHASLSGLPHTNLPTLIVGATNREYSAYNNNKHIDYYFANKDSRDVSRTVLPIVSKILKTLYKKLTKAERNEVNYKVHQRDYAKILTRIENMEQLKNLIEVTDPELPVNFYTKVENIPNRYARLDFQDSIYNFTDEMLYDIFKKTGASEAYGYALAPLELEFPEMVASNYYSITNVDDYTHVNFRFGQCTGYAHKTKALRSIFNFVHKGPKFSLVKHHEARIGPFVIFRIEKTTTPELLTRQIELPEKEQYLRILDIPESVNKKTGNFISPLSYFSVKKSEYEALQTYSLGIAPEAVTMPNLVTFIRNRIDGANLVNKQIVRKWDLPHDQIYKLAFAVYFQYQIIHDCENLVKEKIDIKSVLGYFKRVLRSALGTAAMLFAPIAYIYKLIMNGNLIDKIVLKPNYGYIEYRWTPTYKKNGFSVPIAFEPEKLADDEHECSFCAKFEKVAGAQKVVCQYKQNSKHTFRMDQNEIDNLIAVLADDDQDPIGLRKVKEEAKNNMPKTGFSHTVNVELIEGPPGTGKSYCIQNMAGAKDLVFAPFSKLMKDYKNIIKEIATEDGRVVEEVEDLLFKTTHRAFKTRGCLVIWVDEFTAIDYYMLAVVAFLNAAEKIVLVGDEKQTRILPTEGRYIGDEIDLSKVSAHTLIYNFRNEQDVVALMNRMFGYRMIPYKANKRSIFFDDNLDLNASKNQTIHFKKITAENNGIEMNTVRANQGGTFDHLNLLVTANDAELLTNPALAIVSLTRHKSTLTIKTDGSDTAKAFVASLELNDDFYTNIDQYFPALEDLLKLSTPKVSNPELMEFLLQLDDIKMDPELVKNSIIYDGEVSLNGLLCSKTQEKISRFTQVTGLCDHCFLEKCYCNSIPPFFKKWLGKRGKRTTQSLKSLKDLPDNKNISDERKQKLIPILQNSVNQLYYALYLIMTNEPSFEDLLLKLNIYKPNSDYVQKIKKMVEDRHPIFLLYVQMHKEMNEMLTISKNKMKSQYDEFMSFRDLIKSENFCYDLEIDTSVIVDNFKINNVDKLRNFLISKDTPKIFKEHSNTEFIDYASLRFSSENISNEEYYNDLQKFLDNNIDDNNDDDDGFIYPNEDDNNTNTDNDNGSLNISEFDINELINENELREINDDNLTINLNELETWGPDNFENDPNLRSIMIHGKPVQCYPLREENSCLITALSETSGQNQEFIWGSISSVISDNDKKNYFYNQQLMGEDIIQIYANINDYIVKVNEYVYNDNSNEDEHYTFLRELTFNPIGLNVYDRLTNFVFKQKEIIINYCRNYEGGITPHYYINYAQLQNIPGGYFASTVHSDIEFKPIRKIETILNLDSENDKHNRFLESFNYYLNGGLAEQSFQPTINIKQLDEIPSARQHPMSDSYLLLFENAPAVVKVQENQALNKMATFSIPDDFSNGKFYPETMFNPVNPRLNPVKKTRTYYSMTSGYGLHYNQLDQWQELQCLQNRYLCKKANKKWNKTATDLADEIANLFVDEHFSNCYSTFDDSEIYSIIAEYAEACRKKHYPSQVVGMMDNVRSRSVRFSMKNIFKPGKLNMDIEKAGQGISAWTKDIQVMLGGIIRVLSRHVSNNLKPGVIFNNGMTEKELIDTMNASFAMQNEFCKTAVIDFDSYDATQNKFTQRIERKIMSRLGISDEIIDLYYSCRENYPLITKILRANGGYTKTSGEPGTLLFNTLLAMAITNWVCRGVLLAVILGQGDDVIKRQLKIDEELADKRMKILNQYVDIKMKLEINKGLEFCGFVITDGSLIPSIARKLKKITGHRFRNYEHFCEYQTSLRETIKLIRSIGLSKVIAENANMMNTSYEAAEQHYNMLESFGHINKQEFESMFKQVVIEPVTPVTFQNKLLY